MKLPTVSGNHGYSFKVLVLPPTEPTLVFNWIHIGFLFLSPFFSRDEVFSTMPLHHDGSALPKPKTKVGWGWADTSATTCKSSMSGAKGPAVGRTWKTEEQTVRWLPGPWGWWRHDPGRLVGHKNRTYGLEVKCGPREQAPSSVWSKFSRNGTSHSSGMVAGQTSLLTKWQNWYSFKFICKN